jgi:DNA transformation protein
MAVSPGFAEFVVNQLEGCGPIVTKRMFGGMGIYAGDIFFAIIDDDVLYLKVGDSTRSDFERAGSRPFDPYKDGRASIQYYEVPIAVLEDAGELVKWSTRAIAAASAPKAARRRPARRRATRARTR